MGGEGGEVVCVGGEGVLWERRLCVCACGGGECGGWFRGCVCVSACACVCAQACVYVCVCLGVNVCECVRKRVCMRMCGRA